MHLYEKEYLGTYHNWREYLLYHDVIRLFDHQKSLRCSDICLSTANIWWGIRDEMFIIVENEHGGSISNARRGCWHFI